LQDWFEFPVKLFYMRIWPQQRAHSNQIVPVGSLGLSNAIGRHVSYRTQARVLNDWNSLFWGGNCDEAATGSKSHWNLAGLAKVRTAGKDRRRYRGIRDLVGFRGLDAWAKGRKTAKASGLQGNLKRV
jgi:hypothetical protein